MSVTTNPTTTPRPAVRRPSGSNLVAAGILLSRIAGFARERAMAHYLGNSAAAGAFRAALRIPNLLQTLFGEGVLSASFIPVYARLLGEGRVEEARRVAAAVVSLLTLVVSVLVLSGVVFAPELAAVIAPGFSGETRELTIQATRIMFPGVGLLVLSAWCLGILNSHRRLFLSYSAPVLWNAAMIAVLVAFGSSLLGPLEDRALVERLAWGTVVGSALQLGVQLPLALRLSGAIRPRLGMQDEGVRKVVRTFGAVVMGRGAVQISAYVDQILASFLGAATVAAMGFAQTLYLLPVSLFGMSVSAAELPEMARMAGGQATALHDRLGPALRRIDFTVVPSTVAMLVLGTDVVGALYQTGTFGASDTRQVALILAGAAVGLVPVTRGRLYSSALYALGDARTPLRVALARVTLAAALGWAATFPLREVWGYGPTLGAAGIAAASSLAGVLELVLLRASLYHRIGAPPRPTDHPLARVWGAALAAAGVAFGVGLLVSADRPLSHGMATLTTFGVVYLASARLLGVAEAEALWGRLRRRR